MLLRSRCAMFRCMLNEGELINIVDVSVFMIDGVLVLLSKSMTKLLKALDSVILFVILV